MIYYANVEGVMESASQRLGFFVHCLVAGDGQQEGMQRIREALRAEGLHVRFIHHRGMFDSFSWDDPALEAQLNELATEAASQPGAVMMSAIHTYPLAEKR